MPQPQKYTNTTLPIVERPKSPPSLWIITEGMAGTENQCLGVAQALDITPKILKITLKQPWAALSPWLGLECGATFCPALEPPWPDIVLASGRKSIAASRYIKKKSKNQTFTVQIQDPRINPAQFDLVAVPEHDPTRGENVLVTTATPNKVSEALLKTARSEFAEFLERLPSPRIAVLIGGSTKSHTVSDEDISDLIARLKSLSASASLMITTSRRTGEENTRRIMEALKQDNVYFWDGISPNPYMGMLGWADFIIATNDSTSMLSEAATTGKPVYNIPLVQLSGRQKQLLENLKSHGAVRDWTGHLENWSYEKLNDAQRIATAIKEKSGLFGEI